jgi:hypothetical protein
MVLVKLSRRQSGVSDVWSADRPRIAGYRSERLKDALGYEPIRRVAGLTYEQVVTFDPGSVVVVEHTTGTVLGTLATPPEEIRRRVREVVGGIDRAAWARAEAQESRLVRHALELLTWTGHLGDRGRPGARPGAARLRDAAGDAPLRPPYAPAQGHPA